MKIALTLIALALNGTSPVPLTPAGSASGRYVSHDRALDFSHVVALDQDNAEGPLDSARQVRVVLSDVPVPAAALFGIAFPAVRAMGRNGVLHGVLIEFDPANRESMRATVLDRPSDPAESMATLTISKSEGVWSSLEITTAMVSGSYKPENSGGLEFAFTAPLLSDSVREDVRGPKAQATEQMQVLIARAEALRRGDITTALSLSGPQGRAELKDASAETLREAATAMATEIEDLKRSRRVVVRSGSAVATLGGGSWASLILEDGKWKVAD